MGIKSTLSLPTPHLLCTLRLSSSSALLPSGWVWRRWWRTPAGRRRSWSSPSSARIPPGELRGETSGQRRSLNPPSSLICPEVSVCSSRINQACVPADVSVHFMGFIYWPAWTTSVTSCLFFRNSPILLNITFCNRSRIITQTTHWELCFNFFKSNWKKIRRNRKTFKSKKWEKSDF